MSAIPYTTRNSLKLVAELAPLLIARSATIAVAESCTGGLLAKYLTDLPGASRYFVEGIVAYTPAAKTRRLGIPPETIAQHGVVSAKVALMMAENVRIASGATYGLATTGLAGPDGDGVLPVGTVDIALATRETTHPLQINAPASLGREGIREIAAQKALILLLEELLRPR